MVCRTLACLVFYSASKTSLEEKTRLLYLPDPFVMEDPPIPTPHPTPPPSLAVINSCQGLLATESAGELVLLRELDVTCQECRREQGRRAVCADMPSGLLNVNFTSHLQLQVRATRGGVGCQRNSCGCPLSPHSHKGSLVGKVVSCYKRNQASTDLSGHFSGNHGGSPQKPLSHFPHLA